MYRYSYPSYYPATMMSMPPMQPTTQMGMQDMEQMREMMKKHMYMTQDIHRMVTDIYERMKKMETMMKMNGR